MFSGNEPVVSNRFPSFLIVTCTFLFLLSWYVSPRANAKTVPVGPGSYTTTLPAGATAPAPPSFNSVAGPRPTHRFWTAKNWYADNIVNGAVTFGGGGGGPYNMFPQPLGMQTTANGLLMGYDAAVNNGGTFFQQPFEGDLTIGVAGLNATSVPVSAYTDWTVDFNFGPMTARIGRGMPFVYVTTTGSNPTVTFAGQPTVFSNNGNILGVNIANNNYGLFCPTGGTWSGIGGTVLTCNLPAGHNYFSLALLPNQAALSSFSGFAFSFPTNTQVAAVGNGIQVQVLYDFTGSGTFSRVETYRYFPTNDVVGFESYTQAQGLESSSGTLTNLSNGTIEIKVWNAIGTNPGFLNASATAAQGGQSAIVLPFASLTH